MPLNPKPLKVVDAVGARHPSYITGQSKQQVTVLTCTSAAGSALPPFVIFDGQMLNPEMTKAEVPRSTYGLSPNGWINHSVYVHNTLSLVCSVFYYIFLTDTRHTIAQK